MHAWHGNQCLGLAPCQGRRSVVAALATALLTLAALASAGRADAANLQRVHPDHRRIIVWFSQAELATLSVGQEVVLEINRPRFVTYGVVKNLNVEKQTAAIHLPEPEARLVPRQQVRLLSAFWNPLVSPLVTSYAQYHQHSHTSVQGGFGGLYEQRQVVIEAPLNDEGDPVAPDFKDKVTTSGTRLFVSSYLLLMPRLFGFGFGFDRREVKIKGDDVTQTVTRNQLQPGFYLEPLTNWTLGLRYDLALFEEKDSFTGATFSYQLEEPVVGLAYVLPDLETGLTFKNKNKKTALDTLKNPDGSGTPIEVTRRAPAEVELFVRSISTPELVWGLSATYIFFEREIEPGQPLARAARPEELIVLRANWEQRFDEGDKIDWTLLYAGGHSRGASAQERVTNNAGFTVAYQKPVADNYLVGGEVHLEGGLLQFNDANGNKHRLTGGGASLTTFVQMSFDPLARGRTR